MVEFSFVDEFEVKGTVGRHLNCKSVNSMGGICTIRWVLFALVLSFHISLEALDIRQSKVFLHGKNAFTLTHIIVQIPPMELNDLHYRHGEG
jgi:hypothetical protein